MEKLIKFKKFLKMMIFQNNLIKKTIKKIIIKYKIKKEIVKVKFKVEVKVKNRVIYI